MERGGGVTRTGSILRTDGTLYVCSRGQGWYLVNQHQRALLLLWLTGLLQGIHTISRKEAPRWGPRTELVETVVATVVVTVVEDGRGCRFGVPVKILGPEKFAMQSERTTRYTVHRYLDDVGSMCLAGTPRTCISSSTCQSCIILLCAVHMPMPVPYRSGMKTGTNVSALVVVVEGGMGIVAAQYLAGDLVTVLKAMISASNLFAATVSRRW